MILESLTETFAEANIENINTLLIEKFVKNGVQMDTKEIVSDLGKKKLIFIGFCSCFG